MLSRGMALPGMMNGCTTHAAPLLCGPGLFIPVLDGLAREGQKSREVDVAGAKSSEAEDRRYTWPKRPV